MFKVGFTGTRRGMTPSQMVGLYDNLKIVIETDGAKEFHHGDCVGADAEAHVIATVLGFTTVAHPPILIGYRAFCKADYVLEPREYIPRNHDIMDVSDIAFGAPLGGEDQYSRSGTWAAIRYGRKGDTTMTVLT